MSREGRSQPIQPFAAHGFVDSGVGAPGTAPPPPSVVENDERVRRRTLPLPPVIITGTLNSGVGVPGTSPPALTNVDRADQRARFLPLPAVSLNGLYAITTAPFVAPPTPTVIPLSERARVTPPPASQAGFDLVTPPEANVVEPKDRPRQAPDPVTLNGLLAVQPPVQVLPPGPFVVPLEQRRQILDALGITEHGFVDPGPGPVGTTPPPLTNLDREDQRKRYLPLDPLVLSGVLIPFVPPPPVVVQGGTDWAASIASFY